MVHKRSPGNCKRIPADCSHHIPRGVGIVPVLTAVFFSAIAVLGGETASPKDFAGYWIQNYGVLDPTNAPNAARAQQVFQRVAAAADKRGSRFPRLVLIRGAVGAPLSLAIPDGSIILSEEALQICYRDQRPEAGDNRLAFVLGHELAHHAADDFWHAFAFSALEHYSRTGTDKAALQRILRENLGDLSPGRQASQVRSRELHADREGIVYMVMAGFDPAEVLSQGSSFFEQWVSRVPGLAIDPEKLHPNSRLRARLLKTLLTPVVDDLGLFHFGVRLYQLGRYDEALHLLEAFKQRYPGREVFNNLGLCYLQKAVRRLCSLDPAWVTRFRLPMMVDTYTPAERFLGTLRDPGRSPVEDESFSYLIRNACQLFEQAASRDAAYLPARIKLASALILRGEYSKALSTAEEALKIGPGDPDAKNVKAVALFLYGLEAEIDTADSAVRILQGIREEGKCPADAIYNLARILTERGHAAGAEELWKQFMARVPSGIHAESARGRVSTGPVPADTSEKSRDGILPQPAIPLGRFNPATNAKLLRAERQEILLGGLRGVIWTGAGFCALQVVDAIEIVEMPPPAGVTRDSLQAAGGPPLHRFRTTRGEVLVYRDFALEIVEGEIRFLVFFHS